jgi:hypothetical protein
MIEAMKLALEALEADEQDMVADKDGHMVFRVDVAITALRQAIEQAEQRERTVMAEYKFQTYAAYKKDGEMKIGVVPEPEQEPVAWINKSRNLLSWDKFYADMTPLYTAPPPRQPWVGLTGDEVNEFAAGCHLGNSVQGAIRKAEAKLKEKNT